VSLASGTRIGPYEVTALIGAGGMGEVYRATDTNLRRAVAIKILPSSVSSDADRLSRFYREAQLLGTLNHPHIAQVYGLEKTDAATAIVMELVEGPTLAERIADGALSPKDAIGIAIQIADALASAHDQGIVHRDLKPANIKVRADGSVKVLDFGLAKSLESVVSGSAAAQAPAITSSAMTVAGTVLGTAGYMSPEQARGLPLDQRSDIWAFGCVLFEMLTGRRAFAGDTLSDTIAAVLEREPNWGALPRSAAPLSGILRRCLEKDRLRRLRDIGDVKQWLQETATEPVVVAGSPGISRWWIASAVLLSLVAGAAATGLYLASRSQTPARVVVRFELTSSQAGSFNAETFGTNVAISPDGSRIVYTGTRNGVPVLVSRRLDSLEATPLAGTEGGTFPFFSPDGKEIGYATLYAIKRVPAEGGASVTICPADASFRGASWAHDNAIVFARDGGEGLFRVPASGGTPQRIVAPETGRGEENYVQPWLVDGDTVLYTVLLSGGQTRVVARTLSGGDAVTVAEGGVGAQYLSGGYVVFAQADRLMAIRFDSRALRVTGAPVVVQDRVFTKFTDGISNVSIGADGTTVYVAGHDAGALRRPIWVDRNGKALGSVFEQPVLYARNPRLSPDGRRLALTVGSSGHADIWIYDLAGAPQVIKLTYQGHNTFPVWSSDGKQIFYLSVSREGGFMYSIAADGSVLQPGRVMPGDPSQIPLACSPDGEYLLFQSDDAFWIMGLRDRKARSWLQTPFTQRSSSFSPNGKWVAYASNPTGEMEIWARPFPGAGAPVRVSSQGGHDPVWSRDGKEVFYENGGKLMTARVVTETPTLRFEPARLLFEGGFAHDDTDPGLRFFDQAPDGRLLMIEPSGVASTASIIVVQHWDQELNRLLPLK